MSVAGNFTTCQIDPYVFMYRILCEASLSSHSTSLQARTQPLSSMGGLHFSYVPRLSLILTGAFSSIRRGFLDQLRGDRRSRREEKGAPAVLHVKGQGRRQSSNWAKRQDEKICSQASDRPNGSPSLWVNSPRVSSMSRSMTWKNGSTGVWRREGRKILFRLVTSPTQWTHSCCISQNTLKNARTGGS